MSFATKKQKMGKVLDWKIEFHQTSGLRTLIDVVSNILTRINLYVTQDENGNTHLGIDSIDPQQVCMIQSQLSVEKSVGIVDKKEFCIDASIFNLFLKNLPSHYSLNIEQYENTPDLRIFAYESLNNNHTTEMFMPTYMENTESMNLGKKTYDYTIEMDLLTLRQFIKMTQALQAKHITLKVFEPKDSDPTQKNTMFTIESDDGDSRYKQSFYSSTIKDSVEDTCIIKAQPDQGKHSSKIDWVCKFDEDYSTSYMSNFLKSMDRQVITIQLTESNPFIMHYSLSTDGCYLRFVLAPKNRDD